MQSPKRLKAGTLQQEEHTVCWVGQVDVKSHGKRQGEGSNGMGRGG